VKPVYYYPRCTGRLSPSLPKLDKSGLSGDFSVVVCRLTALCLSLFLVLWGIDLRASDHPCELEPVISCCSVAHGALLTGQTTSSGCSDCLSCQTRDKDQSDDTWAPLQMASGPLTVTPSSTVSISLPAIDPPLVLQKARRTTELRGLLSRPPRSKLAIWLL
jgi:hypothetical protein